MLEVEFGGHSVAGKKPKNDDAFSAHIPSNSDERQHKGAVACIADGVSNSDQAKIASQTAVTHFINDYYSTPDSWNVQKSASRVISSINSWLFNHGAMSHTRTDSAVTTFDSIVFKSQTAHIFHVGDSRVYLYRNNQLSLLTRDHINRRGDVTYLSRGLGIDSGLDIDYIKQPIEKGDIFFLSTDGTHEFLNEQKIIQHLEKYITQQTTITLETTAHQIVGDAIKNESDDNTSCLLIEITQLPIENLNEAHANLANKAIPPVLEVGNKIDHFEIKKILHSSTRSHVYLAEDTHSNGKRVVLKAPSQNFADDTTYLEAFKREYWLGRKLSSDYLMKIHPQPDNTRFLYHICDYIEGATLRQWMIDNPEPPLEKVRSIASEIAKALRSLHRNSVVHRDLKPDNIMLDHDGNIRLIDLGAAHAASWDEIDGALLRDKYHKDEPVGDADYIAPEYLLSGKANKDADRFSLAVIIYEMLSGQFPYNAIKSNRTYPNRIDQWIYQDLPNAKKDGAYPDWLNLVLKKALSPKPEQRFPVLSEFIGNLSAPDINIQNSDKLRPLIERNPLLLWKGLSILLTITSFILLGVLLYEN